MFGACSRRSQKDKRHKTSPDLIALDHSRGMCSESMNGVDAQYLPNRNSHGCTFTCTGLPQQRSYTTCILHQCLSGLCHLVQGTNKGLLISTVLLLCSTSCTATGLHHQSLGSPLRKIIEASFHARILRYSHLVTTNQTVRSSKRNLDDFKALYHIDFHILRQANVN